MEQDEASRIRALGEIAAEFDLDAIRVRTGDSEIEIVRRDPAAAAPPVAYAVAPGALPGPVPVGPPAGEQAAPAAPAGNIRKVTAPLVGVFYRASSPGSDPFIEVGSRVTVGQTLCILEAMKLMNEINSDYAGVVARIIPENGELVTVGQDLFWIEV